MLDIPFSQVGEFVYHCHILEHEDGGMMAKIVVVPEPLAPTNTTHDFNADFNSDIFGARTGGDVAIWLMTGAQMLQSGSRRPCPRTGRSSGSATSTLMATTMSCGVTPAAMLQSG